MRNATLYGSTRVAFCIAALTFTPFQVPLKLSTDSTCVCFLFGLQYEQIGNTLHFTPLNMPPLTKKQSEVFNFIKRFVASEGYAPSYREIAEHFGLLSPATAYQHVQSLIEKGVLMSGEEGLARSIEVVETDDVPSHSMAILPLAGLIAAGEPIEAVESNETIGVPSDFVMDQLNSYVLRVKGSSMIEDGILDGDYVVVERNNYPKNGEVVVALLHNSHATLKRFYKEDKRIRLQPANKAMQPIFVRDVIIQGVVRAVIRRFQPV